MIDNPYLPRLSEAAQMLTAQALSLSMESWPLVVVISSSEEILCRDVKAQEDNKMDGFLPHTGPLFHFSKEKRWEILDGTGDKKKTLLWNIFSFTMTKMLLKGRCFTFTMYNVKMFENVSVFLIKNLGYSGEKHLKYFLYLSQKNLALKSISFQTCIIKVWSLPQFLQCKNWEFFQSLFILKNKTSWNICILD